LRSNHFNLADEIADEFYPIGFVRDFPVDELIFDHDNQFNNIELVESEIVREVRVSRDRFDIDFQMLGDERANVLATEPSSSSADVGRINAELVTISPPARRASLTSDPSNPPRIVTPFTNLASVATKARNIVLQPDKARNSSLAR
jgi:hypothetical protein